MEMKRFICFAHRGGCGHAPENTLLAIRKSMGMGASWLEVDIYRVDNELLVIHDHRLDRTTNGSGDLSSRSLSYIRALDAGEGEKIPFLKEVLDVIDEKTGINIELKGSDTVRLMVRLVAEYITLKKLDYRRLLVSAFDHRLLLQVRALDPRIRIGALIERSSEKKLLVAEKMGAYSVHLHLQAVNSAIVEEAHRRGLKVFVYTVNDRDEIRRLQGIGVDGVFTDFPALCLPESLIVSN